MTTTLHKLQRTIAAHLTAMVIFSVAVIFLSAAAYTFLKVRSSYQRGSMLIANKELNIAVERVRNLVARAETVADNIGPAVEVNLDSPELMPFICEQAIENNPDIYGCSISFEPYYYPEIGEYYSPYAWREPKDGRVYSRIEGSDTYNYFEMIWYIMPRQLGQNCWTDAYLDFDEDGEREYTVSYARILHDKSGKMVGILTIDLLLQEISELLNQYRPYPHSYTMLLDLRGNYIVCPDPELLYTPLADQDDPQEYFELATAMKRGETGFRELNIGGDDCFVFFRPLEPIGWPVALVCFKSDVFSTYNNFRLSAILIFTIGVLFLILITWRLLYVGFRHLEKMQKETETE